MMRSTIRLELAAIFGSAGRGLLNGLESAYGRHVAGGQLPGPKGFFTVNENVVFVRSPVLSFAVIVTCCVWPAETSVVSSDQLQVPLSLPVLVTFPTDAEMRTRSESRSCVSL